MKLAVKTLKGGKFTIEVEPSNTVAEVKGVIETNKSELPAASMKLIHSGKVLKDDDKIESCNIKPNDFLVVMIAKAKKAPAPKPAAAAPAAAASAAVPATPAATTANPPTPAAPAPSGSAATATTPAAATASAASDVGSPAEFPAEVVNNLKALGFPDSEVMACLRAANGNADLAVEFLMNGIPPGIPTGGAAAAPAAGGASAGASGGSGGPLEALRSHPQFDALRRLVQTNPSMLQSVLQQIGTQQPELLQAINANQAAFLEMMNEPVADAPAAPAAGAPPAAGGGAGGAVNPFAGIPGMEALGNPAQLSQMLQAMPPQEQQAMAQMMGMDVNQLQQLAQVIAAMPPEQVQQHMNMAMQAQGLGGMMGGAGAGGAGMGGPQVLRLSEEEMAAVDRLTEMGFDRTEAAQAYLACDKNEALAANLLMDGGFGGFGGGGGDADMGGNGGAGGDDDMYD
ncbi:hypothetical protein ACHAXT_006618 [Thalassiosira profunda]